MADPFLRWVGGKTQLLKHILPRIPKTFDCYYEPFLGGGAVALAILKPIYSVPTILSDLNSELITTYTIVRDAPTLLLSELNQLFLKYTSLPFPDGAKEFYYELRSSRPVAPLDIAARMIFLNRTCFNGLYRVNSKGGFNVPFGKRQYPQSPIEEIGMASTRLKRAILHSGTYQSVLDTNLPSKNDFVYLDPPYVPLSATANFTGYTEHSFGMKEQEELAQHLERLDGMGVKWMLSNSAVPWVTERYRQFKIDTVECNRRILRRSGVSAKAMEVLIRNYD